MSQKRIAFSVRPCDVLVCPKTSGVRGFTGFLTVCLLVITYSWSFLILGPCFGLLSDRFDRRRTVIVILFIEMALSVIVGLLLMTGQMTPGLMLVYMVFSSVCKVLDTTNRPALIYDLLFAARSEHLIGVAMALRSIGGNFGRICGNQLVGWVVEVFGIDNACLLVSLLLLVALLLLCCVPSPPKASLQATCLCMRLNYGPF